MVYFAVNTATKFAIEKAGGAKALGKALGISHQAIGQWRQVPPLRVIQIETLTGVHRSDLRPDLYPPETAPVVEASS
jgi:DNA-binding transcriptional regulator YdaS (Cro superfamily)